MRIVEGAAASLPLREAAVDTGVARHPRWARRQRHVDPLWTHLAGGCHLTRDTEAAIVDAGFVIDCSERFIFQPCWLSRLSAEHVLGAPADLDSPGYGDARLASQLTECEPRGRVWGHEGDLRLGLSIWRLDQEVRGQPDG